MTTLKELTWDAHKRAEQTHIMRALLTDQISTHLYAQLLYTKYEIYSAIEDKVKFDHKDLYRAQATLHDWQLLGCSMPACLPSLDAYVAHLRSCDSQSIWGHVYVHYLAPLYGGQIIKKKIQHRLPVMLYEFEDPHAAIAEVRSHLGTHLVTEANLAFEHVITYYSDLWKQHNPS